MTELELRLEQIALLYRNLTAFDFEPETSTGALVRKQARPRGRIGKRALCEACGGEGFLRRRGIAWGCVHCGGADHPLELDGERIVGIGRGYIVVDGYTRRPIGSEEAGLVHGHRLVNCDACGGAGAFGNGRRCERCGGAGKREHIGARVRYQGESFEVEIERSIDEGDPVFACLLRRDDAGSFAELIRATEALRGRWLLGYRLIVATYVEGRQEPGSLPPVLRRRLDVALRFVERLMPPEIRVPGWAKAAERRRLARLEGRDRSGVAA